MLSPQLRRKVLDLWSLFWTSGLSNPLVAIEQITYLLFIRQLEALDRDRENQGKASIYSRLPSDKKDMDPEKCRWSYIRQNPSFELLNDTVFPWLRDLETRIDPVKNGDSTLGKISYRLNDAYFILDPNKADTLKRAVGLIDDLFRQLDTRSVNADIMGDIFEYLLEEVKESGKNGQFRTPRHVIRFMVELLDPELGSTILDPACGSGGFLINTLLHWKSRYTGNDVLRLEWDGTPHNLLPIWPRGKQHDFSRLFHGYDNDRTMVRIAWMNLILHGLETPEILQLDSLSKRMEDDKSGTYDYILANPPFTGNVDKGDLSENRTRFPAADKGNTAITTKSELLFVWLMLDLLRVGGRAAVIVPDGVLFGSTKAHRELRRQLLFENTLEGVVSLPANMFQPYSGVKTSILVFQKLGERIEPGGEPSTREVWFYEVADEAYSLDQKRKSLYGRDNDLWDALVKFRSWRRFLEGESDTADGNTLTGLRNEATSKLYHQPDYWEERWRNTDDDFKRIFPEKSGESGTFPIHDLWPDDFPFDAEDARGARQYEDAVLSLVGPKFREMSDTLVKDTVKCACAGSRKPDLKKVVEAVVRNVRSIGKQLQQKARGKNILDREFDQFGLIALKEALKEIDDRATGAAEQYAASLKRAKATPEPDLAKVVEKLESLLDEFAKLDGYNVWRRGNEIKRTEGKQTVSEDGEPKRVPTRLSWVVPVREWAQKDFWNEDPETEEKTGGPTHVDGVIDTKYFAFLRDDLRVFDTDGTVKKAHHGRLDPDCLEALDFNLAAGRHKPFVFDPGEHRPPAEIIDELQAIHGEIQKRLGKLLGMVEGRK